MRKNLATKLNHWLDDHIIDTTVKLVYREQSDISGLLTCAYTHAQENSLLPVVMVKVQSHTPVLRLPSSSSPHRWALEYNFRCT